MATGAILAGGLARRFGGQDKTQVRVGGQTILERQLAAMRPCVDRMMLVGYRGNAAVPEDVVSIADEVPDLGPLGGLDAALDAAGTSPVLLLACDLPFLTTDLLAFLLSQLGDDEAVVPRTERGYHPLCAVYAASCRGAVRRRLEARALRLRDLFDDLRVRVVGERDLARFGEPSHLLANVNSQADLDALESLRNH